MTPLRHLQICCFAFALVGLGFPLTIGPLPFVWTLYGWLIGVALSGLCAAILFIRKDIQTPDHHPLQGGSLLS